MDQFPGNSHTSRIMAEKKEAVQETPESVRPIKIVNGKVSPSKRSLGSRFKHMFVEDGGSFGKYLVDQVIEPMLKDIVLTVIARTAEGFQQGIEERLFGESRPRSTRSMGYGTGRPTVNYNRVSTPSSIPIRRDTGIGRPVSINRRSNLVKDVFVDTREDGDLVLEELDAMIDSLGHCTVGDFYSLVGITPRSTDHEWGWNDLSSARVNKIAGANEFQITMPRPRPIDR